MPQPEGTSGYSAYAPLESLKAWHLRVVVRWRGHTRVLQHFWQTIGKMWSEVLLADLSWPKMDDGRSVVV